LPGAATSRYRHWFGSKSNNVPETGEEYGTLTVYLEGAVAQTVTLRAGVLRLGRLPDNDIRLDDGKISRHHAELRVEVTGLTLTDLGSSNGTFLDGTRLLPDQPTPLRSGQSFEAGPFTVLYRAALEEAVAATRTDGEDDAPAEPPPPPPPPVRTTPAAPEPARMSGPRPHLPAVPAAGPQSRYLEHLPIIFQEDEFLGRYLLLFESIWEPLEHRQDHVPFYIDPHTAPDSFLPWLAGWLNIAFNEHWPEPRRRALLAEAIDLYRWRGTRYGLARMLEVCGGVTAEVSEDANRAFVVRVRVRLPAGRPDDARREQRELVEELVRAHKPAHVGYILEFS
jgi:phage tail-like protein